MNASPPRRIDLDSPEALAALQAQARRTSDLLKALSHETRLMILCLLSEREMSVSEIERVVALPQATVSQQLARLRLDRLVATRREGRTIHYRLADREIGHVIETLHELFCGPARDALAAADAPPAEDDIR